LAIFLLITGFAPAATADEQRIDVIRNGVQTTLVLPEYTSQGIPYASLTNIATQIGGALEVGDARAVLRLGGKDVATGLEDDKVQVGGASMTLRHPIRGYNGDALIAFEDLLPVLRAGFGFGTPENPPSTSALSLDSVEPDLESIETTPPATDALDMDSLESIDLGAEIPLESVEAIDTSATSRPLEAPSFGSGSRFVLAVDPGHGGDDTGVVGPGGLTEKVLCLSIAEELRRVLKEQYGIATVSTRDKDEMRSMKQRRQALSGDQASLVLSIHTGANAAPGALGPMLFAHVPAQTLSVDPKPGLGVARALAGAFEAGSMNSPPVYEMPLLVMRGVTVPGVLIELGNLKNPEDEARLASAAYQSQLVSALASGINQLIERPAVGEAVR